MSIRKLWAEYLKTANKLYGLAIMVFLPTMVIALTSMPIAVPNQNTFNTLTNSVNAQGLTPAQDIRVTRQLRQQVNGAIAGNSTQVAVSTLATELGYIAAANPISAANIAVAEAHPSPLPFAYQKYDISIVR